MYMRFKRIYIEVTNECNLNCSFCATSTKPKRAMTVSEFEHICSQIRPYTDYIYLHIQGEPLLHPEFEQMIKIASSYALSIQLVTNGTLLSDKRSILCQYPAIRQVSISLQSLATSPRFKSKEFRDQLIFDARQLAQCGRYVQFRLWTYKSEEMSSYLIDFFHEIGIDNLEKIYQRGRRYTIEDGLYISLDEEFKWPSIDSQKYTDKGVCYGTKTMMGILSDGTVVPCCLDYNGVIDFGNIFTDSFESMISSERFIKMNQGLLQNKLTEPLCQHCGYRTRFD